MKSLVNKRILMGVSGSIAAYKAVELVRRLREAGAEVRVILTSGGAEFVTPLTFQAVSGHPVYQDLLDEKAEAAMGHIELARWADAVVVAPASANCLARLAQGRADDLLSAVCLATTAPLAVAPAMNQQMWAQAATQENITVLRQRGVHIFGPASGEQACGEVGPGRMVEALELAQLTANLFESGAFSGVKVVVTAGPTQEAVDPVRDLSNRSSGKMGYAVAQAAAEAGAQVVLVTGPTALEVPERVEVVRVESALEMHEAVMAQMADCRVFIAAAAVADYRPASVAAEKIKKGKEELTLNLTRNPDILAEVSALPNRPFCVGFAAETEQLEAHARAKLEKKRLDMIAANWVGEEKGFERDDNALLILTPQGRVELPQASKASLARELVAMVAKHLQP
jgi:phosphopantothenoylcysteine decarboxylase/phosphopantothenate--cysteine ligase